MLVILSEGLVQVKGWVLVQQCAVQDSALLPVSGCGQRWEWHLLSSVVGVVSAAD